MTWEAVLLARKQEAVRTVDLVVLDKNPMNAAFIPRIIC